MRCTNPYIARQGAYGCGQCMPCRVNRRRVWSHRIQLEAMLHAEKCFVTLTYGEDNCPAGGSLAPGDFRDWLKRMRRAAEPSRLRFYGVGEYGDTTERPHYHVALFGWPSCRGRINQPGKPCPCVACSVVRETWGFGHVLVGTLNLKSAQYLAGYVTKKMTKWDDPRLAGRHPEFARMSLRPGIGADAMHDVASVMMQYRLDERGDVPSGLRHGAGMHPLGRYLRKKLRTMVGKDEAAPPEALHEAAEKLQLVRAFALSDDRSVKSVFAEINGPYAAKLAARDKFKERSL